jgi:hypothetical protein
MLFYVAVAAAETQPAYRFQDQLFNCRGIRQVTGIRTDVFLVRGLLRGHFFQQLRAWRMDTQVNSLDYTNV